MKAMHYLQKKWQRLRRQSFQNTDLKSVETRRQVKRKSTDEDTFLFI